MRECPACKLCFKDDVANCPIDGDATFHSIAGDPVLEGKYQLENRLGQGGMGVVYKARHNFLKTQHAIKVILPDLVGNDPQLVTRFRQEAIAAAAIRHQNIVSTTDFGVVNGKMPFIVMEFVKGESLHDLLVREKRLSPIMTVQILSGICSGLAVAHRQGIVHRDLKPLNVMIVHGVPLEEGVKILDFGLAKIKSGELLGSFIAAQTTGLMGSPYYMAPEQWSDEEPDVRSDVYSLGVMLYQMLSGDVPFKGSSIPAIMKKHLSDAPPRFETVGLSVAPEIEAVVVHALEKDAEKRTETVEQLVRELREAVGMTTSEIHLTDSNLISRTFDAGTQDYSSANISTPNITGTPVPVTTLRILTNPPQSKIFLNNKSLGESEANGWLIAGNIGRGTHRLRVSSDGFLDSESEIICDGEVCQTVVQLRSAAANHKADAPQAQGFVSAKNNNIAANNTTDTMVNLSPANSASNEIALNNDATTPLDAQNMGIRSYPETKFEKTNIATKSQEIARPGTLTEVPAIVDLPPVKQKKTSFVLPVLLAVGLVSLILIGGAIVTVYTLVTRNQTAEASPTTAPSIATKNSPSIETKNSPQSNPGAENVKNEQVKIAGDTFQMGIIGGQIQASPPHSVTVKSFSMDKTEVTNAEYAEFIAATGHRAPEHWNGGKPLSDILNLPVVAVSLDDAKSFAKWRSERDGIEYRLPTEKEWEFAARNGASANTYPWGNAWAEKSAVIAETSPWSVGSMPQGANKWGVVDLIGNVWEWTDSKIEPYPGSTGWGVKKDGAPEYVIRGGSVKSSKDGDKAINSAFRQWVVADSRNPLLGFRLVSEANN